MSNIECSMFNAQVDRASANAMKICNLSHKASGITDDTDLLFASTEGGG